MAVGSSNPPIYSLGLRGMNCCGWGEFSTLTYLHNDPAQVDINAVLKAAAAEGLINPTNGNLTRGSILMTEAGDRRTVRYARIVAKLVEEKKLGQVVSLPEFVNPNTKRKIRSFVWILDQDAVKAYMEKNKLFEVKKVW